MSYYTSPSPLFETKRGLFNILPSVSEEDNIIETQSTQLNRPKLIPLNSLEPEKPVEPDLNAQRNLREVMKSNQKSLIEAQLLYGHVKKFPFFEAFNDRNMHNYLEKEAFIQLCQRMKYEKHPAKSMIFQQGDTSKGKVYIIFSGAVYSVTKDNDKLPTTTVEDPPVDDINSDSDEENKAKEPNITDNTPPNRKMVIFDLPSALAGRNKAGCLDGSKGTPNDLDFSPKNKRTISPNTFKNFSARETERSKTIKLDSYHRPSFFAGVSSILDISDHSDPKDNSGSSLLKLPYRRKDTIDERQQEDASPTPDSGFFNFMRMSLVTNRLKHQTSLMPEKTRQNSISPARTLQRQKTRRRQVWLDKATLLNLEEVPEKDLGSRPSISLRQMITQYGTVKNKISSGGFFGEKALFSKQRRSETIITKSECEFLVINKRDFRFVSDNYDYKRKRLLDFMMTYMPDFENITATEQIDILLCALNQRTYERDSYITKEGESGDHLYILYEGSCEIVKTLKIEEPPRIKETVENIKKMIRVNPSSTQEVTLCKVDPGEFLGMEVIFTNRGVYDLSVKVYSSQAKVFVVDKSKFYSKFSYVTRYHMEKIYDMRRENHIKTMCNYVANKFTNYKISLPEKSPGKDKANHDLLSQGPIALAPLNTAKLNNKTRQLLLKGSYAPSSSNSAAVDLSLTKSKTMVESSPRTDELTGSLSASKSNKEVGSTQQANPAPTEVIKKKLDAFSRIAKGTKLKAISDEYHIGSRSTRTMSTHVKTNSNVFSTSTDRERRPSPFSPHDLVTKLPLLNLNSSINNTVIPSPQRSRPVIPPLITNSARGLSSELGIESPKTVELSYASGQRGTLSYRELRSPLKSHEKAYFEEINSLGYDFDMMVMRQRNKKRHYTEMGEEVVVSPGKNMKQYSFTRVLEKMKDKVEKKHKKANKITELVNFKRKNAVVDNVKNAPEMKDSGRTVEAIVTTRSRLDSSDMILKKEEVMSPIAKEKLDLVSYDLGMMSRSQSEEKKDIVVIKKAVQKQVLNVVDSPRKSLTIVKAVKNEYYGVTKVGVDYGY